MQKENAVHAPSTSSRETQEAPGLAPWRGKRGPRESEALRTRLARYEAKSMSLLLSSVFSPFTSHSTPFSLSFPISSPDSGGQEVNPRENWLGRRERVFSVQSLRALQLWSTRTPQSFVAVPVSSCPPPTHTRPQVIQQAIRSCPQLSAHLCRRIRLPQGPRSVIGGERRR